ncbi:MAG: WYL domain-containing protein [Flavobacteriales bacterium]|jgi:predicted DNA-binding transcriptional regulator YafY|nr:WYL domain-containing protein [Flavobacteriales bacterium]
MSQQGKLKRYLLILERLKHAPTLAELSEHLSDEGFELNYRTIQRDLAELRDEFGVDTVYDRSSNTYSITGDEEDLPGLMQLLERAQLLELVRDGGQGLGELRRYIHFEELGRLRGIKHIAPLLRAIRERREVKVLYQKFYADTAKRFRIQPHLLKEYRGRWYVLGPSAEHVRPIALGLDRIKEITMLAKRFKRYDRKIAELYDQAIGVDTSPEVPERIVLRFNAMQAPYAKALPLHPSQQVEEEDKDGATITLFVMANFELRQIILALGNAVRVLEPKYLAKEIKQAHLEAARQYGK